MTDLLPALSSALPVTRASRPDWYCAAAAFLLFLVLAISSSLKRGPWWDEGLFADVAIHFRNTGHFGSSVLAPYSFNEMPGVDRYTYWQFPMYLVSLGAWFRLTAPTICSMRAFSILWGCIFAGCWFLFVRRVSRDETLALCVASVVALDYSCINAASDGRMDMMCAGLWQAALASFVCLRDSHRRWASFLAGLFGAASLFCHPMGAITNGFLAVLLLSDRNRMRRGDLSIAALPYVVGAVLCMRYILEAPQIFLAQAKAASSYRVGGFIFLLGNVLNEFRDRYLAFYELTFENGAHAVYVRKGRR